jgi:hypothetical protein
MKCWTGSGQQCGSSSCCLFASCFALSWCYHLAIVLPVVCFAYFLAGLHEISQVHIPAMTVRS